ncbi:protein kinase domain-containing protein [Nocardia sp. FBN12]|uniref:serine/threonine-protein kinase n=1 Tax=Nocardia sp. FBN12 TaxID=3419766 RepID=UPI003D013CDA
MLRSGEVFAGYVIERLLGAGGMGEVYAARHPRLPRSDAVKVLAAEFALDPRYRVRFEREADLAAGLSHPAIVKVYDRGECDGRLWIAMELVEGVDLAQRLSATGQFAADEVARIAEPVAAALDRASAQGLVHRDVKPANILMSRTGDILLTDFGIARHASDNSDLTGTGVMIGTLNYASPEQLHGLPLDGRSDQYSLACSVFHLLTGAAPFTDANPAVVVTRHATAAPPSVRIARPELGPEVDSVLARAMSKRPADRFATSSEFAAALGSALRRSLVGSQAARTPPGGGTQAAIVTVIRDSAASPPPRRGIWAGAGAAAMVVVAVVIAFALWPSGPEEIGPTEAARAMPRISVTAQSPDLGSRPTAQRWRQPAVPGSEYPVGGNDKVVLYNRAERTNYLDILDAETGAVLRSIDVGRGDFGDCVFTRSGRYAGCRAQYAEAAAGTTDVDSDSYATKIIDVQAGVVSGRLGAATEIVTAGEVFALFEPERKSSRFGSVTVADSAGTVRWQADGVRVGLVRGAGVLSLENDGVSGDPFSKPSFELRDIETGTVVYRMTPDKPVGNTVWAPDWAAFPGGFAVGRDFYALDGTKRSSAGADWRIIPSAGYSTQGDDPSPNGGARQYAEPTTAAALPVLMNKRAEVIGAFDPATGSVLWSREVPKEAGYSNNPAVAGIGGKILFRWDATGKSQFANATNAAAYAWFDAYTADGGLLPDEQIPWATDGTRVVTVPRSGKGTVTVVPSGEHPSPLWSLDFTSPIRTFEGRVYVGNRRVV